MLRFRCYPVLARRLPISLSPLQGLEWRSTMRFKMRWVLALLPAIALAMPAFAQGRDTRLSDSQEPGSVLIFPKFINKPPVITAGDNAVLPRTEIEIGVVCPPGVTPTTTTCFEHQTIKIKFHWVCPGSDDVTQKFICPETD